MPVSQLPKGAASPSSITSGALLREERVVNALTRPFQLPMNHHPQTGIRLANIYHWLGFFATSFAYCKPAGSLEQAAGKAALAAVPWQIAPRRTPP